MIWLIEKKHKLGESGTRFYGTKKINKKPQWMLDGHSWRKFQQKRPVRTLHSWKMGKYKKSTHNIPSCPKQVQFFDSKPV